jgi:periplasmic protein TonB
MQTNKILSAPLIDLVFDGRDKDYGAYELRKNYSKRINRAMIITLTLAALISGSVILANTSKKSRIVQRVGPDVELTDVQEKLPEPLPEPERPREVEQPRTEIYTAPRIMPTDVIDNPLPTIDDLDSARIGDVKIKGPVDIGIPDEPKDPSDGKGIVDMPKPSDEPLTFVEIDAKFTGNWVAFLERNLNANVPVDNGAAPGRYSVIIRFVVDREGVVSDINPLTSHGYGMEQEAIRVIRKSAKWEPAIQNNIQVKAYRKQVIVFIVNEE